MLKRTFSTRRVPVVLLALLLLGGCAPSGDPTADAATAAPGAGLTLPDGLQAAALPYTFDRPTQFLVQDNVLWVAQLSGGENESRGTVVAVDLATGRERLVAEGLDKPTGIALVDDMLWIATRDAILRLPADGSTPPTVVVANLPNNGRSNGTLTPLGNGQLLYETSGNSRDADSGKLWQLDTRSGLSTALATGLKGGYAHAIDGAGRVWLTEIADGTIGGETAPDELNLLAPDADFGWPRCYGRELAGPDCSGVRPAVTVFDTHATPTSVALSPFVGDTLLVALWQAGTVVAVPVTYAGDNAVGDPQPFLSGLRNPQHLFVTEDGALLVSDFAGGRIYRIAAP